jgi:hypothetical protein
MMKVPVSVLLLVFLFAATAARGYDPDSDVNHDGVIDGRDIFQIQRHWHQMLPTPTGTNTGTPTNTPTSTPTFTSTHTATSTPTDTPFGTPGSTPTPTATNVPPRAMLTVSPGEGPPGLLAGFIGVAKDTDGTIDYFGFNVAGTGIPAATEAVVPPTPEISRVTGEVYLFPGVYPVAFYAWDNDGGMSYATGEVVIWTMTPTPASADTSSSVETE